MTDASQVCNQYFCRERGIKRLKTFGLSAKSSLNDFRGTLVGRTTLHEIAKGKASGSWLSLLSPAVFNVVGL